MLHVREMYTPIVQLLFVIIVIHMDLPRHLQLSCDLPVLETRCAGLFTFFVRDGQCDRFLISAMTQPLQVGPQAKAIERCPAFALSMPSCTLTPMRPAVKRATRGGKVMVSRRRRALAVGDKTDSGDSEPDENGESEAVDSGPSDLALPDLRSLFEGAGDPECGQCTGKGETPCPVCDAKGFVSLSMMDTVSSSQCRMCKGKRSIPCPSCRQEVYKSVLWWDLIPSKEEDPDEQWREGPDGEPRIRWSDNPAGEPPK